MIKVNGKLRGENPEEQLKLERKRFLQRQKPKMRLWQKLKLQKQRNEKKSIEQVNNTAKGRFDLE
jgi:hypothetical protein